MKAFIVALLVASTSAYHFGGMRRTVGDEMSLLRGDSRLSSDLTTTTRMGELYPTTTFNNWNVENIEELTTPIVSLEEVISHPLFRVYYNLPLFRQMMEEHPVVFGKYIRSALFLKFWNTPSFMEYFRTQVLFYKYIVPQIKLVAKTQEGIYNYETLRTPTVRGIEGLFGRFNTFNKYNTWSVPMNKFNTFETEEFYPTTTSTFGYKTLLEKMMRNMEINGQDETLTNVRVLPTGEIKENTIARFFNPITGMDKINFGDIKTVDEKIVPVTDYTYGMDKTTTYLNKIEKEMLLKKLALNRIYGEEELTTPFTYNKFNPIFSRLFNKKNYYNTEDVMRMTTPTTFDMEEILPVERKMELLLTFPIEKLVAIFHVLPVEKKIELLYTLPVEKKVQLLSLIPVERLVEIFHVLPIEKKTELFHVLPLEKKVQVFFVLPLDKKIQLFYTLPMEKQVELFHMLPVEKKIELLVVLPTEKKMELLNTFSVEKKMELLKRLEFVQKNKVIYGGEEKLINGIEKEEMIKNIINAPIAGEKMIGRVPLIKDTIIA